MSIDYQEYKDLIEKIGPLTIDLIKQDPLDVLEYTASMNPKEAFILGMLLNRALNKTYGLYL